MSTPRHNTICPWYDQWLGRTDYAGMSCGYFHLLIVRSSFGGKEWTRGRADQWFTQFHVRSSMTLISSCPLYDVGWNRSSGDRYPWWGDRRCGGRIHDWHLLNGVKERRDRCVWCIQDDDCEGEIFWHFFFLFSRSPFSFLLLFFFSCSLSYLSFLSLSFLSLFSQRLSCDIYIMFESVNDQ